MVEVGTQRETHLMQTLTSLSDSLHSQHETHEATFSPHTYKVDKLPTSLLSTLALEESETTFDESLGEKTPSSISKSSINLKNFSLESRSLRNLLTRFIINICAA